MIAPNTELLSFYFNFIFFLINKSRKKNKPNDYGLRNNYYELRKEMIEKKIKIEIKKQYGMLLMVVRNYFFFLKKNE